MTTTEVLYTIVTFLLISVVIVETINYRFTKLLKEYKELQKRVEELEGICDEVMHLRLMPEAIWEKRTFNDSDKNPRDKGYSSPVHPTKA